MLWPGVFGSEESPNVFILAVVSRNCSIYMFSRMFDRNASMLVICPDVLAVFAKRSCLWRSDGNMAAPAVLHSLLWLQVVLHSPHAFQEVLNSLLTKATREYGMENSTLEQSSTSTLVGTFRVVLNSLLPTRRYLKLPQRQCGLCRTPRPPPPPGSPPRRWRRAAKAARIACSGSTARPAASSETTTPIFVRIACSGSTARPSGWITWPVKDTGR